MVENRAADDTKELELQTVQNDSGSPAPRRLATPAAADTIFEQLLDEDSEDALRRATLQGMIDGNNPYSDDELEDSGLGHITNVNFMTMRANLDARAAAAHELFVEVPTAIECYPKAPGAIANPDIYHWCSIVAEEFSQTLEEWRGRHEALDLVVRESDAYGIGYMLFENEWEWRPKAYRRGNLLMDPKASVDVNDNEIYMIRGEMQAADLFELLDDEEVARNAGWKPSYIKQLLVQVFREKGENGDSDDDFQQSPWESLQHRYRNNDPEYQSRQFDRVRVVHILVQEVHGERRVSHLIMPEKSSEPVFIYEGLDKYEQMDKVIWWLPYNYGDGYARSVRGVASHMAQHDDLSNRFLCRVFDAGFMSSSLLLQPNGQGDLSRLQFMHHGPYTILPPEVKAIQSTFQPQIAPLISLRRVSEEVLKNNTGTYRQHSESLDNDTPKTARQVMAETSQEARYEKAAITHRYNMLDNLYSEIFRRVTRKDYIESEIEYPGQQPAKDFIDRCVARGVPKKFLYEWEDQIRVATTRAIGLGSASVKYDITSQILNVSGSFDENGKRNALFDFVAARVGYRNAHKYVARMDRDQITSNESSIAALEDNDMFEGSVVVVGHDQVHKLHIDSHVARIAPIIQAVDAAQVQDPVTDFRTMQLEMQHIAGHLQYLAPDKRRADYVAQIEQFLQIAGQAASKLQAMAKRVMADVQKQQQAQAEQVGQAQQIIQDREFRAKVLEIQKEFELETMKQESINEARRVKTAEQMQIQRGKAVSDTRLKAERQAAELAMESAKTRASIDLKRQDR